MACYRFAKVSRGDWIEATPALQYTVHRMLMRLHGIVTLGIVFCVALLTASASPLIRRLANTARAGCTWYILAP